MPILIDSAMPFAVFGLSNPQDAVFEYVPEVTSQEELAGWLATKPKSV
jgi:hypothetical protein